MGSNWALGARRSGMTRITTMMTAFMNMSTAIAAVTIPSMLLGLPLDLVVDVAIAIVDIARMVVAIITVHL